MNRTWGGRNKGFTIVELLVVVVVIAILVVITIVTYNGLTKRAQESATATALSQVAKDIQLYKVHNRVYPNSLEAADVSNMDADFQYTGNKSTYCVTGTVGSTSMYITEASTKPTKGGCPGHGQGGLPPAVNLAVTPRGNLTSKEWLSRYSMAQSLVSNAPDGPLPSLNSYYRLTQGTAVSGSGRGIDHRGNIDTATPTADLTWAVSQGETVFVSVYTRASVANSGMRLMYRIHNGAGGWATGQQIVTSMSYNTPNNWVRLAGSFTVPANGYIQFTTRYNNSASWPAGATIDGTGLMVVKGVSSLNYADPIVNSAWVWNGAVNLSNSTGPAL